MQHSRVHHLRSIAILSGLLAVVSLGTLEQSKYGRKAMVSIEGFSAQLVGRSNYKNQWVPDTMQARIASRMKRRLAKGSRITPSHSALVKAVHSRQKLLGRGIKVHFATDNDPEYSEWSVSAQRYPLWIKPSFSLGDASFKINTRAIQKTFEEEHVLEVDPPVHAILRTVNWAEDEYSASRVEIEGIARSGYLPNPEIVASSISKAFGTDLDELTIPLPKEDGRLINMTGIELGDLRLWAAGNSDYKGSTYARSKNVQKALNQHVNNTIVGAGEIYSFNSTLDGPVSQGNGWHMAKVI
ncbi:MAG: hypothetical protein QF442_02850, partial [Candidatus Peribacteraceae bacterium]|nr:hypothetical protein [Candidatus Peribacteraceae bacterium]